PWGGLPDGGAWRPERIGNRLVFWGRAGSDVALWATDGTAGGTALLGHLAPAHAETLGDRALLGDRLLYWAKDAAHPSALWATEGTPEGTVLLRVAPPYTRLVAAGGVAYFTGPTNERELWRTDGTPAGTVLLRT